MKILFCDEIPVLRDIVSKILSQDGHQVDTAFDGQDALEKLQSTSFDLPITDNRMPRLTGVELVEKLRDLKVPIKVMMASMFFDSPDQNLKHRLQVD